MELHPPHGHGDGDLSAQEGLSCSLIVPYHFTVRDRIDNMWFRVVCDHAAPDPHGTDDIAPHVVRAHQLQQTRLSTHCVILAAS